MIVEGLLKNVHLWLHSQISQAIATTPQIFPGQNIKNKNHYILPNEAE